MHTIKNTYYFRHIIKVYIFRFLTIKKHKNIANKYIRHSASTLIPEYNKIQNKKLLLAQNS